MYKLLDYEWPFITHVSSAGGTTATTATGAKKPVHRRKQRHPRRMIVEESSSCLDSPPGSGDEEYRGRDRAGGAAAEIPAGPTGSRRSRRLGHLTPLVRDDYETGPRSASEEEDEEEETLPYVRLMCV